MSAEGKFFHEKTIFFSLEQIANWAEKILGRRLFKAALKLTAFGHFVGGETIGEIKSVIDRLLKYGVQPILDYSVESDDGDARSKGSSGLDVHQENCEKFLESIEASRRVCGANNLVAIKLTALIRPSTLRKLNHVVKSIENRFKLPIVFQIFNENFLDFRQSVPWSNLFNDEEWNEVESLIRRLNQIGKVEKKQNSKVLHFRLEKTNVFLFRNASRKIFR